VTDFPVAKAGSGSFAITLVITFWAKVSLLLLILSSKSCNGGNGGMERDRESVKEVSFSFGLGFCAIIGWRVGVEMGTLTCGCSEGENPPNGGSLNGDMLNRKGGLLLEIEFERTRTGAEVGYKGGLSVVFVDDDVDDVDDVDVAVYVGALARPPTTRGAGEPYAVVGTFEFELGVGRRLVLASFRFKLENGIAIVGTA